mgnify:CR=1 FL=1
MNITKIISDNTCIHCGNVVNENLRKWFKDKWVNIGKKKKGGGHPPCGTSGKKRGYAKCVPKSKAAGMTKKQKASATRRKRAAQNKAGRGGTDSTRGGGKKPINVSTKPKKRGKKSENKMNYCQHDECVKEAKHYMVEKKDKCYHKVKARYDVWPSAYASGALVKCRKVGAANWGNKTKEDYPGKSVKSLHDDEVNERTKMKPQVKKLLKQKGYSPIFGAIDNSKRQLKQMRYSRGEIRDTLISMFGDEDPKILQKIKESINEKKGDFLDSLFPKSKVAKAVKIAHDMGGDMTGAVKKIEKYFKGMTLHSKVRDALQQANESINEKKGVPGSVFTIDTAKKTSELMTKALKKVAPDIRRGQIYHSALGGADRVSIVGKFSLDPKKTWANNILENSRFITFHLDNDGTLEVNVNGYPFAMRRKVQMRKSRNNDIKQVLKRMITHFSMLNKKYPEGM